MAETPTTNHGLSKQAKGDANWHVLLNSSLDKIDQRLPRAYAGNPNGNVAGLYVGQLIWNSVTKKLYICTTVGAAADAIWELYSTDISGLLVKANNLSDLTSVSTARTNLGLGSAATLPSTTFATAAQGTKADSALQPGFQRGTSVTPSGSQSIPATTWTTIAFNTVRYDDDAWFVDADECIKPNVSGRYELDAYINLATGANFEFSMRFLLGAAPVSLSNNVFAGGGSVHGFGISDIVPVTANTEIRLQVFSQIAVNTNFDGTRFSVNRVK